MRGSTNDKPNWFYGVKFYKERIISLLEITWSIDVTAQYDQRVIAVLPIVQYNLKRVILKADLATYVNILLP